MSKILKNNEVKEKHLKTQSILIYADFVRSSNKVESKINYLLKLAKEQNINYIRTS